MFGATEPTLPPWKEDTQNCTETSSCRSTSVGDLVGEYFAFKHVPVVVLITCSFSETVIIARRLGDSAPAAMSWTSPSRDDPFSPMDAESRVGLFVNLDCARGKETLQKASEGLRLSGPLTWLVWSTGPPEDLPASFSALQLAVDSDVVLAHPDGQGDGVVRLLELVKASYEHDLQTHALGRWAPCGVLRMWPQPRAAAAAARQDLQGKVLRAAVVLHQVAVDDPASLRAALVDRTNTHMDSETRFGFAITTHLSEMYNFSMDLHVTASWGYAQANGSFDGMIGMLQSGNIQFGITPAVITKERLAVVDFTVQTWKLRTCFIFRHPRLLVPYAALVKPFTWGSWLAVGAVSALAAVVLWEVRRVENREEVGARAAGTKSRCWEEAVLTIIGLLSQQGSTLEPRMAAGRTVVLTGLVLSLLLQSFYTSAIVTSLLTPIPRTIRTVDDLIRSPLRVGLEDYSYNRAVFPKSKDPLTARVYAAKIVPSGGFFSVADGIARVRKDRFAFYSEDSTLYNPIQDTFSDDEKCALSEVELNPAFITAAPVLKRWPYRELFNRGLLLMRERGVRARQRAHWSAQRPSCTGEANAVAAVGMDPIFPAHAILALGHVLALVILAAEHRINRVKATARGGARGPACSLSPSPSGRGPEYRNNHSHATSDGSARYKASIPSALLPPGVLNKASYYTEKLNFPAV